MEHSRQNGPPPSPSFQKPKPRSSRDTLFLLEFAFKTERRVLERRLPMGGAARAAKP
jgi:hypothetical protein